MSEIHPTFYDLIPSVVRVVHNRFRKYVDRDDLLQECYAFAATRSSHFKEMLDEPNTEKRVANEKRVAWQLKRVAERYARKEKAVKSGYQVNDEAYYETTTIAQLLPFVISSILTGRPLDQGAQMVDDGQPKRPSVPAEGGNFLAILMDVKRAYLLLDIEYKDILEKRYFDNWTLNQIAQYLELSISSADRRVNQALNKIQDMLGGDSPYS